MSDFDKNTEKKFLGQLLSDLDGTWIVFTKSLLILTIVPFLFVGFIAIKNSSYKKQISNFKTSIKSKDSTIVNQKAKIESINKRVLLMQSELTSYEQQTSEITAKYKQLSKQKHLEDNGILKDIQVMRKNISKINRQMWLIEKRLNPEKQAGKDK